MSSEHQLQLTSEKGREMYRLKFSNKKTKMKTVLKKYRTKIFQPRISKNIDRRICGPKRCIKNDHEKNYGLINIWIEEKC